MPTVYSYIGSKDVTLNGQRCIPWIEIANNGGTYLFRMYGFDVTTIDRELISDMSEDELHYMEDKCR